MFTWQRGKKSKQPKTKWRCETPERGLWLAGTFWLSLRVSLHAHLNAIKQLSEPLVTQEIANTVAGPSQR